MKYSIAILTALISAHISVANVEKPHAQYTPEELELIAQHSHQQNVESSHEPTEPWEINKNEELAGLFQGDILLSPGQQPPTEKELDVNFNAINGQQYRWTNATIPYIFDPRAGFTAFEKQVIHLAMQDYTRYTCIRWVPWTNQQNYVTIISGGGCYSQVGMMGGMQHLSLMRPSPSGTCVIQGIADHEMMHCSGFYHEQSRTDRDNYVTINRTNIQFNKAYNFDKYGSNTVNPLGTKYDYGSIMHYGQYDFSTNYGVLPTIITNTPAAQTLIGQRKGFSATDAYKLNKYYSCPVPYNAPVPSGKVVDPHGCTFDTDLCGWTQDYKVALDASTTMYDQYTDDFDWMFLSGSTPSFSTGPSNDHTTSSNIGMYLYAEASSPRVVGDVARIRSPIIQPKGSMCITFWYHMYSSAVAGSDPMGGLRVLGIQSSNPTMKKLLWVMRGNQGNQWNKAMVDYNAIAPFQVAFEAVRGHTYASDIAIDDFFVAAGPCSNMHPAHPPIGNPAMCTFEAGTCGYVQDKTDQFDWTYASGRVGPITTGSALDPGSSYMIAIGGRPMMLRDKARLITPSMTAGSNQICLHFHTFFVGSKGSSLNVFCPGQMTPCKSIDSSTVNTYWAHNLIHFAVTNGTNYKVTFEATKGIGPLEDFIAIDYVGIRNC